MLFLVLSVLATLLVVVAARVWRSRTYAIFRGVTLGLHSLIAAAIYPTTELLALPYLFLHSTVYVHSLSLIRPRMRSLSYRCLVSIPASYFSASTLLALPWALVAAIGFHPTAWWLPYLLGLIGLYHSLTSRPTHADVTVRDGYHARELQRIAGTGTRDLRPLRIVQISDPHLGPFMSVARLRGFSEAAVREQPDLVLLTGDFLTMESQGDPRILSDALAPLKELQGRVYACFGNHDHEAPRAVRAALSSCYITLLVDAEVSLTTEAGRVQLIGFDFRWRGRAEHIQKVCERFPRAPGALRVLLLHDPAAFCHVPDGQADLVLSGHTHGGQVGAVSLGLRWTILRLITKGPDHGLWGLGNNRLYVHRGTGHYGFPLRLGVPAEHGVIRVHNAAREQ